MFQTWQYQKEGLPTLAKVKGEAIWVQNLCRLHIVPIADFHLDHIEFALIVDFIKGVNS
jgi:hypothetical protein